MPDLSKFGKLANKVNKQRKSKATFVKNSHVSRKDRHTVQINMKYYLEFRKLAFENPGTNITEWVDQALQYTHDKGIFKKYLK